MRQLKKGACNIYFISGREAVFGLAVMSPLKLRNKKIFLSTHTSVTLIRFRKIRSRFHRIKFTVCGEHADVAKEKKRYIKIQFYSPRRSSTLLCSINSTREIVKFYIYLRHVLLQVNLREAYITGTTRRRFALFLIFAPSSFAAAYVDGFDDTIKRIYI